MDYKAARERIKTGDLLGLELTTPYGNVIKACQTWAGLKEFSAITHVGFAQWWQGRLFILGMDGIRNAAIPLSQYKEDAKKIHVFRLSRELRAGLKETFSQALDHKISYDYSEILTIGLRLLRKQPPTFRGTSDDALVCSSWGGWWLRAAGANIALDMSPGELCHTFSPALFSIEESKL